MNKFLKLISETLKIHLSTTNISVLLSLHIIHTAVLFLADFNFT